MGQEGKDWTLNWIAVNNDTNQNRDTIKEKGLDYCIGTNENN